jgi:hypothetical protein
MWTRYLDRTPYRKLYAYQFLKFIASQFNSNEHKLNNSLNGKSVMNIKEYLIKLVAIFALIYIAVIFPLSNAIKSATQGIDFALAKPSTKWIITGLITNPETLFVLANQELEAGNKKKANMFVDTAMGIIESNDTNPAYKKKFYKLKEQIMALPDQK